MAFSVHPHYFTPGRLSSLPLKRRLPFLHKRPHPFPGIFGCPQRVIGPVLEENPFAQAPFQRPFHGLAGGDGGRFAVRGDGFRERFLHDLVNLRKKSVGVYTPTLFFRSF